MSQEANQPRSKSATEVATLAGGCFWCMEAVYDQIKGVAEVESGYAGGRAPNPSYKLVCSGTTGHAEVVQITFDPSVVSFNDLLDVFFTIHDPTTLNRQGNDVGTQYRSAIFYHTPEQKAAAEQKIAAINAASSTAANSKSNMCSILRASTDSNFLTGFQPTDEFAGGAQPTLEC